MKNLNLLTTFFIILLIGYSAAQPYEIPRSVFGSGGGITVNNEYRIIGTVGQPAIGEMSDAANYINKAGFWYTVNFQACTPGFLGDVNADDAVNSTDALIILSFDAGLPIPQPISDRINIGFGDVNDEGITNSTDALIILSYDVGIPVPFPVGDPVCLPNSSSRSLTLGKTNRSEKAKVKR